jgi:ElaB/YqjD/DUF883 family membrane-anchored ribosome-binding protein
MERNDAGNTGEVRADQGDANEFSGSGSTQQQGSADGERSFDFAGSPPSESPQGIRDRARNVIGTAGGRLADVGSTVRDRAGAAKEKLAGALETGAERLRERAQGSTGGATLAGATAEGSTPLQADGKIAQVSDRVAGGMDATAAFLRDADLDSLKSGLERQVKEHPGRTLLIAAGLGYLIGRAFRNNQ